MNINEDTFVYIILLEHIYLKQADRYNILKLRYLWSFDFKLIEMALYIPVNSLV